MSREVDPENVACQTGGNLLQNVWKAVRRNSNSTVQKLATGSTSQHLANGCLGQTQPSRVRKIPRQDKVKTSRSTAAKQLFEEDVSVHSGLSKAFEKSRYLEESPLMETKKTNFIDLNKENIGPPNISNEVLKEYNQQEEILLLRLEHFKNEVAKKDTEILNLKKKIKELKTMNKGLDMIDPDSVNLSIENSRLTKNISRLSELLAGLSAEKDYKPSVLSLLYPPFSNAFIEAEENFPGKQRVVSRSKDSAPATTKQKVRPCCKSINSAEREPHNFSYDEVCNWVPSAVHKALKQLSGSLGLSADKELLLKSFLVKVNKAMLKRNQQALDICANLCKKEVQEAKRNYLDQPIITQNVGSGGKKKTDRAAFLEGASWILTKVQTEIAVVSTDIKKVMENLSSSPSSIVSAMSFTNDNLLKIKRKLDRYNKQVNQQSQEEKKKSQQRRQDKEPEPYGIEQAERDERKGEFDDSLSESI